MDWSGAVSSFFSQLGDLFNDLFEKIFSVFPDSPFQRLAVTTEIYKYLRYLNWVLPVSYMLSTMALWLSAVAVYYLWSLLLRWVKAID